MCIRDRLWTVSKIFQFENTLYKAPGIILNISPTKVTCNNKNIILIFLILNNLNVVVVTYLLYRPTVFSPLSLVGLLYSQSPTFTLDSCLLLWRQFLIIEAAYSLMSSCGCQYPSFGGFNRHSVLVWWTRVTLSLIHI